MVKDGFVILVMIILLITPTFQEAFEDKLEIKKTGTDNHMIDVWQRIVLIIIMSAIAASLRWGEDYVTNFKACIIFSTAFFVSTFNYILNLIRKLPLFHLSDRGYDLWLKKKIGGNFNILIYNGLILSVGILIFIFL